MAEMQVECQQHSFYILKACMIGWKTSHEMQRKKPVLKIASKPPCSLHLSRFKIYFKSLLDASPTSMSRTSK